MNFWRFVLILVAFTPLWVQAQPQKVGKYNILFIISDDLTSTALGCYGNRVCKTPNIDRLAERGTLFQRAYCQFPVCGPSRASLMNGYYPHATQVFGYVSGRAAIGDRTTWAQHFKEAGYHTTRVSKIFHMGVPGDIEKGSDGTDDPISWNERYNSPGPEWKAKGKGETLENNPDGKKPAVGGNTFVVVAAEGDDLVHSDGKTAQKAAELLKKQPKDRRFFLAVGFVRPHVPFVAPAPYFAPYPHEQMKLPLKVAGDWDDIPPAGINYKTSTNMKMDIPKQKKAVGGYYAAVSYMDAMVGQVLAALKEAKLEDNTIVIFTSDHGYHLGEHDFWAKVSVHEESAKVPLIVAIPGQKPAVCNSFVELLDLFPTTSELCGLPVPNRLQGKSLAKMIVDPTHQVRDEIFCVNGKGLLIRTDRWAYIQYGEDRKGGMELFDMHTDPGQYTNLAHSADHQKTLQDMQDRLKKKLQSVRENDLPPPKKKK
ncbi:MAG: sulfatase [Zavarzinella sp.]